MTIPSLDAVADYIQRTHNVPNRKLAEEMAKEAIQADDERRRFARQREEMLSMKYETWLKREFGDMDWDSPIYQLIIGGVQAILDGDITQLIINVPPRIGKCLARGTPVIMADGTRMPIESVSEGDMVLSVDKSLSCVPSAVTGNFRNGEREVSRYRLDSGQEITCTPNHPVLTVGGWKPIGSLVMGEKIVALKSTGSSCVKPLLTGMPSLIGYIVGDGRYNADQALEITTADPFVSAHLDEIAASFGWSVAREGKYTHRFRNKPGNRSSGKRDANAPVPVMMNYIKPGGAYDKRVPACIMSAREEDVLLFLAAYFNCDGTVAKSSAEFYSVSRELLSDTQYLLRKIGIYSRIYLKNGRYRNERHVSYRLHFDGQDLVRFCEKVPVIGEKGDKLRLASSSVSKKRHYPSYESVPAGWTDLMNTRENGRVRYGEGLRRKYGIRVDKSYQVGTARHLVEMVSEIEDNDDLRSMCSADIVWERLVSVESAGVEETYDLEVAGVKNFAIECGAIVHNSESVTIRLPVFWELCNPSDGVIVGAYNKDLAETFTEKSLKIYQDITPGTVESSLASEWSTVYNGFVKAAGVGTGIAGRGCELLIVDDPVKNYAEAHSPTYQKTVWNWWLNDLRTRRNRMSRTPTILIMTRWTEDDLTGKILSSPTAAMWEVIVVPAISTADDPKDDPLGREKGESILPVRLPIEDLLTTKVEMGRDFDGLYQQEPKSEASYTFKSERIVIVEAVPVNAHRVRYFDRAGTEGGGDWTVGVLMALDDFGIIYIEDVVRGQWAPEDVERTIEQTIKLDTFKYGKNPNYMMQFWIEQEPASSGKQVAYATVRKMVGYEVFIDRPSDNKDVRARPFAAYVNNHNVRMLQASWNGDYIMELSRYIAFGKREHDDQVDGSSGAFSKLTIERLDVQSA